MWTEALRWKSAAEGGSASAQAVMRVNADQASKGITWLPTNLSLG